MIIKKYDNFVILQFIVSTTHNTTTCIKVKNTFLVDPIFNFYVSEIIDSDYKTKRSYLELNYFANASKLWSFIPLENVIIMMHTWCSSIICLIYSYSLKYYINGHKIKLCTKKWSSLLICCIYSGHLKIS